VVFLTENKNTDTDADTRGCHTHAVSRTRAVSTEERGVSPPVDGSVS